MNKLLTIVEEKKWYHSLAKSLSQKPFYSGVDRLGLEVFIIQLGEAIENGDSCMIYNQNHVEWSEVVHHVTSSSSTHKPLIFDPPYFYLQRYWQLEHQLAIKIKDLISYQVDYQRVPLQLFDDEHQQKALEKGVNSAFCMITGGPGTGKTYILTRIVAVLKSLDSSLRIAMAAPTGKAAQRMQEALQAAFVDPSLIDAGLYHDDFRQQQTQTLHRLLGMGNRQIPKFNAKNPLPYDVVVVDEASMLDLQMAKLLFDAIQSPTRLILLGDADQLSSVDVGYVLSDLQHVQALAPYQQALIQSRRFFDGAMIGRFAKYIYADQHETSSGKSYEYSFLEWQDIIKPVEIRALSFDIELNDQQDWVGYYELATEPSTSEYHHLYQQLALGFDDYIEALQLFRVNRITREQLSMSFDRYRILVTTRHGALGLRMINQAITEYIKDKLSLVNDSEWFYGRAVMMTYNDYQLGLSNGDIGICLERQDVMSHEKSYQIYFPSLDREIAAARLPQSVQTAFAMTIHKSQGSEFRHTAVVLDQNVEKLLSKELLYTGITRAKKMVSLYCSREALEQSLQTKTQRQSGLQQQIERLL